MVTKVNCPTCSKLIEWTANSPFRPFCSERCKLIDLGCWGNEEFTIPGEQASLHQQLDQDKQAH